MLPRTSDSSARPAPENENDVFEDVDAHRTALRFAARERVGGCRMQQAAAVSDLPLCRRRDTRVRSALKFFRNRDNA